MTALAQYQKLETGGFWRPGPDAQRREVTVSFGEATLVLSDPERRPVTHWSLPAVERVNPGKTPAIYAPDVDQSETLELDDEAMIEAIETIRNTVQRRRSGRGWTRTITALAILGSLGVAAAVYLPSLLREHTVRVVPEVKKAAIGGSVLQRLSLVAGQACNRGVMSSELRTIRDRVIPDHPNARIVVFPNSPRDVIWLPGDILAISNDLLVTHESPLVLAGALVVAEVRAEARDPMDVMLEATGLRATFGLLTTGDLDPAAIRNYGEVAAMQDETPLTETALLGAFTDANIPAAPYVAAQEDATYAMENDTSPAALDPPLLSDGAWVRLQQICR